MNPRYRSAALALFPVLAGAFLLGQAGLHAIAVAPQSKSQDDARKADSPFCAFVRKIVAAVPSEFVKFKGEEDTINGSATDHSVFRGTLAPDGNSECDLFIRREENGKIVPSTYYCVMGPYSTVAGATLAYEKETAGLRACFPEWQFTETNGAGGSDPTEVRVLSARQPLFTMVFTLSNMGINSKPDEPNSGTPRAVLSLRVTGNVPPAPPAPTEKK